MCHFVVNSKLYPSLSLAYSSKCSKKTNTTMGCLDTSRGRKFLHSITASWEGRVFVM